MESLQLEPVRGPLSAVVTIPGSKSLTNRALLAAALADGTSLLSHALFADDTRHMIEALRALGFAVTTDESAERIEITGAGGHIPTDDAELFCGNSGTTLRFCSALVALGFGRYSLDGVERMRERPIGPLADALRSLGAGIEFPLRDGFPPLTVHAQGLRGGTIAIDRSPSSQFISAVLLASPAARDDVMLEVRGPMTSRPYVHMTLSLMDAFGVSVIDDISANAARFIVPAPQPYRATNYHVEPDASNASYFLAAPAIAGGSVTVADLGIESVQGDARFVDVLERMGCQVQRSSRTLTVIGPVNAGASARLVPVDIDLNEMPDMVQTTAVLALYADGPSIIRNVANLRLKETDRLAALATELTRLGARVRERPDGLTIEPPVRITPAAINTYDDHRMAMSFALIGLREEGIEIRDPQCVSKTFPDFFQRWTALGRSSM